MAKVSAAESRARWNKKNPDYHRLHRLENIDAYRIYERRYNKSPRGCFTAQRRKARKRGIPWMLSFEEWLSWWGKDFAKRGRAPDKLCMSRIGDKGPYQLGNLEKVTNLENRQRYYNRNRKP